MVNWMTKFWLGLGLSSTVLMGIGVAAASSAPTPDGSTALTEGSNANWWISAQRGLAEREYALSRNDTGLQAPNRAHGFRTYFDTDGIRVLDRGATGVDQTLRLTTLSYGRAAAQVTLGGAEIDHENARFSLNRSVLLETYENRPTGLQQTYKLMQRPQGTGNLIVVQRYSGASALLKPDGLELTTASGLRLRYAGMRTVDAHGRTLPSHWELNADTIRLVVADTDAAYPLSINSLLSGSAENNLVGDQADALLGSSVASAGDVNDDGYADLIVGAPRYDNGQSDEGIALIYHGGALGVSGLFAQLLESNQANARFGTSVDGADDFNGDGYTDVVAGAPQFDSGQLDEGAAFAYYGGANGINAGLRTHFEANQAGARFGTSVASVGDINGDGYADVVVGADGFDVGSTDSGAAFVFHGAAAGVNPTATLRLEALFNQASAYFGASVAGAGDLDADGYADLAIGAPTYDLGESDEGAVFTYHGSSGGVSAGAFTVLQSNQANALFGGSVAGAGDVNGDSYADIIVGALRFDGGLTDEGAAFVYRGGLGGVDNNQTPARLESDQADASFGGHVAGLGDVNGDGYADVAVGAELFDNGQSNEGAVRVYYGNVGGFAGYRQLESDQSGARFGVVAGAGDVNGDGYADILVGASAFDGSQADAGAAFVYHGAAGGIMTFPARIWAPNQSGAALGATVAGAGDLNGDGYSDVAVGAPYYDNGEPDEGAVFVYLGNRNAISPAHSALLESNQAGAHFGESLAGAGDVNADGKADLLIGSSTFQNTSGATGAAFVYHGSIGGVGPNSATRLELDSGNAGFAYAVSGAGDVNGDGYADVLVGAPFEDNVATDLGATYVFHGGATGIKRQGATRLQLNQANAYFGASVAAAGDTNGDGYGDVIIGAPSFDNGENGEGAAFVFYGAAAGVGDSVASQLESNQQEASSGTSVAGAGDVNGDGFDDVVVGAYRYDGGELDEGAAFVHHGSVVGVAPVPALRLEQNQANAHFGFAVAGAGDVNGDGFGDLAIGAYRFDGPEVEEGAAWVYHGSAAGIGAVAHSRIESNQGGAFFGMALAGVGDINGDGYADIVVGAPYYNGANPNEGAAFVYLGNSPGRSIELQQRRRDIHAGLMVNVIDGGLAYSLDRFLINMRTPSPRGRERIRLEAEVCPAGVAFGAPDCATRLSLEPWPEATAIGWENLDILLGLLPRPSFHWRIRTLYAPFSSNSIGITRPSHPPHGPWRRLQALADAGDIRTGNDRLFADDFEN